MEVDVLFKWAHVPIVQVVLFWGDPEVRLPLPPLRKQAHQFQEESITDPDCVLPSLHAPN